MFKPMVTPSFTPIWASEIFSIIERKKMCVATRGLTSGLTKIKTINNERCTWECCDTHETCEAVMSTTKNSHYFVDKLYFIVITTYNEKLHGRVNDKLQTSNNITRHDGNEVL
uniref:Uncharacterized protein n=1 Tax=Cacopsylla melanoneura TaxID=428564 RepID=A0A8D8WL45_9HEMI